MPRVLFVFTGGTISMKFDPVTGGAVPALSGADILAFDPGLAALAGIEVIDFGRYPGPHMNSDRMWALSELLATQLSRPEIDAAVITHGTDTLEETAYLLDLRHVSPKPIAFVGAMRNSSELSYDGPANLRAALRAVIAPEAHNQGVFVVLNQLIHAASEATKTDTQQLETFASPVFGPLGIVDNDRVLFTRRLTHRTVIQAAHWEPRVDLIPMHSGADSRFLDFARESGAQGIVIDATGRGNVTPAALPGIQRALDGGLPVLIASRCLQGRVLDTYGYEGSGRDLRRRGVLFAGRLTAAKARILLMLALGKTRHRAELQAIIENGAY
jgi:L-asparaginase